MGNEKLYPEEPDNRQRARVELQTAMEVVNDYWARRGDDVTDEELQQAIDAMNQAGKRYADTF